ncbi:FAD binding domain-containing protein [Apiospora rasikravindrae]|uniref:FAD binding domain-containing protein n=1 Tax=Apiospora rasikravindrae TaxID=990691 RepID=A0ABR1SD84_9PEZI
MSKPALQALVSIAILGSALASTADFSLTAPPARCKCFPGDTCWPTPVEWAAFNKTINGRLVATVPIASVCHHDSFTDYDVTKCQHLRGSWLQPEIHYTSSSSIMAQYFANMSCDPFSEPSAGCMLGNYVHYAVDATGTDDYQKTMDFATRRNVRFVIRNTGHDYFGKSTGAGALALWTHHMKDISVLDYESFHYNGKALKMGAGVQVQEALTAAHAEGLIVSGGQCQTVGIAGGYTQAGGHSLLASVIGLSADLVLEWEVVTPTGEYLVATPSSHSDLYWALSGGGGGAYAAVLSVTVKAFPDVQTAAGTLTFTLSPGVTRTRFFGAVKAFLQNLPDLVDAGGAALWTLTDGYFSASPVFLPNGTLPDLQLLLTPIIKELKRNDIPYSKLQPYYLSISNANWLNRLVLVAMNAKQNVTDGNMAAYLWPRDLVTSEGNAAKLTDTLDKLVTGTGVVTGGLSFNVTRPQKTVQPIPNSVNPAWRTSIHYSAFGLPYNRTSQASNDAAWDKITNVYAPSLDRLVPGGMSSYINEANPFDPNWKRVFYGNNYDKLLQIKDKYDPAGILYGLTVVGSDRYEVQKGGRLCRAQRELVGGFTTLGPTSIAVGWKL